MKSSVATPPELLRRRTRSSAFRRIPRKRSCRASAPSWTSTGRCRALRRCRSIRAIGSGGLGRCGIRDALRPTAARRPLPAWSSPAPRSGSPHAPLDGHPVEAVDHGTQVHLAGGDGELRDVGEPLLVRRLGVEVARDEVVGVRAYLASYEP